MARTYVCKLSMDEPELAQEEVLRLSGTTTYRRVDDLVVLDADTFDYQRLAYTKSVFALIGEVYVQKSTDLQDTLRQLVGTRAQEWTCSLDHKRDDKRLSTQRCREVIKGCPKDTTAPKKDYIVLLRDTHLMLCERLWENDRCFLTRAPHKRPEHHPASINPKLARCLVNLSGLQQGTIYDPMCGVGGILIEAGLCGLSIIGSDIDPLMLRKARTNIQHYGISVGDKMLFVADATQTQQHADTIITDVPYSRSTKQVDVNELITRFLAHTKQLTNQVIIIIPSTADKASVETSHWRIVFRYTIYIHKTLSKIVYLLEN